MINSNFLSVHEKAIKNAGKAIVGSAATAATIAAVREQQLARKQQLDMHKAEVKESERTRKQQLEMHKVEVKESARRGVRDEIWSIPEALDLCKRVGIHSETECLGATPRSTSVATQKKYNTKYSNKSLRGGGTEDHSFSNGLTLEAGESKGTTPKNEVTETYVEVSASPLNNSEGTVLPASAPYFAGVIFMGLYFCFNQIIKKNTGIRNFFATNTDKILENQAKMQETLDKLESGQQEIRKKI